MTLEKNYDYIIVGAGSAGCVIARRLIDQSNAKVLLLEAGGSHAGMSRLTNSTEWPFNMGSEQDYRYNYEPNPYINNRKIDVPRGKGVGGSGSINAMVWSRGNKYDYDGWAEAGNKGWDYASVLPLFKKIEDWEDGETDFHGAGGPISVERSKDHPLFDAMVSAGQSYGMPYVDDINGPNIEGIGRGVLNVKNEIRQSPAMYLEPIMDHENFTLLTYAKVLKLNFEGKRCIGLDFIQNEKSCTVKASEEVILCAGAIDTPRILMLSGIGDPEEFKKLDIHPVTDLPGVGKNLQDHIFLNGLCFESKEPLGEYNSNLASSTIHWKSRYDLPSSDLMFFAAQIPVLTPDLAKQYPPVPANTFSILPSLLQSNTRGYIKMKTSKHDGPLEIQYNMLEDPADMDALVQAVRISFDLIAKPAFKELMGDWAIPGKSIEDRESIVSFIRDAASSYWHVAGTCAMGNSKASVVSDQLLVRGIDGLRIADASVMPKITTSNTQAPTMMIGEFAARLILGK